MSGVEKGSLSDLPLLMGNSASKWWVCAKDKRGSRAGRKPKPPEAGIFSSPSQLSVRTKSVRSASVSSQSSTPGLTLLR